MTTSLSTIECTQNLRVHLVFEYSFEYIYRTRVLHSAQLCIKCTHTQTYIHARKMSKTFPIYCTKLKLPKSIFFFIYVYKILSYSIIQNKNYFTFLLPIYYTIFPFLQENYIVYTVTVT